MNWTLGLLISLLGLTITYFSWKATHFRRPTEIEEAVRQTYADFRVFNDADLEFTAVNVVAAKPGFPRYLYKYIPFVKREGFVEVQLHISPKSAETTALPDIDEIEERDIFPDDSIAIRNVT
ncbi:hypothetical protein [Haladaptatus salinisoli]|uniref:hypothetical protein n=1 Tax=Haladaptatus salinisoli TaxID=2884876 RepID=UPI001D0AC5D8|nr:hypothetical protein [Haladaptatus salinisoli]